MSKRHIAIIGAGPAGLKAAEVAVGNGCTVSLFDAMPSSGRKFLVAGKSGLNITHDEPWEHFLTKYSGHELPTNQWNEILNQFDNTALCKWAAELGIETFTASSGKVFPKEMKAAPLLRRWIEKMRRLDVQFFYRHQVIDFRANGNTVEVTFSSPAGDDVKSFDKVIFALGGGSWRKTGSTGEWVALFEKLDIAVNPLTSANCGWEVDWDDTFIKETEGKPLKNLIVRAGAQSRIGELVITRYGLEGGPIYRLGPAIRSLTSPKVSIDFKPSHSEEQLIAKMESAKRNLLHEAKLRWKLNPATYALLQMHYKEQEGYSVKDLARTIKSYSIDLKKPRPIDEVISSAGGVKWSELDENLMVKNFPNIYCVGEMLDWEAPTGGYLLQACFATGSHAGKAASSIGN